MHARRALIVHDNPAHALGLEQELIEMGYRVDVVDSGLAAIRKVWEEPYDRILLDAGLRGMRARDLEIHIRNLAPQADVATVERRAA